MKPFLALLFISLIWGFTPDSYAQQAYSDYEIESDTIYPEKKLKLSLEYMGATTKISEGGIRSQDVYGQSGALHVEYPVAQDVRIRVGVGLLQVGEKILAEPNLEFRFIEETYTHTYVYVPVGLRLISGNYFIIPEIGFAFNRSNRIDTYQISFLNDEGREEEFRFSSDIQLTEGSFSSLTIPIALSAGVLIPIKQDIGITISAKIFTSTNSIVKDITRKNRYSGAGLVVGLVF